MTVRFLAAGDLVDVESGLWVVSEWPARGGGIARPGFRRGPAPGVVAGGPATFSRCRMARSTGHRRRDIAVGERSQPEPASAAIGRRDHVGYLDRRPGCCGRLIPGPPGVPQEASRRAWCRRGKDVRPPGPGLKAGAKLAARRCRRRPDDCTSETSDPVRSRRPRRVAGRGRRRAVAAAPPRDEHLRGGPGYWLAAAADRHDPPELHRPAITRHPPTDDQAERQPRQPSHPPQVRLRSTFGGLAAGLQQPRRHSAMDAPSPALCHPMLAAPAGRTQHDTIPSKQRETAPRPDATSEAANHRHGDAASAADEDRHHHQLGSARPSTITRQEPPTPTPAGSPRPTPRSTRQVGSRRTRISLTSSVRTSRSKSGVRTSATPAGRSATSTMAPPPLARAPARFSVGYTARSYTIQEPPMQVAGSSTSPP